MPAPSLDFHQWDRLWNSEWRCSLCGSQIGSNRLNRPNPYLKVSVLENKEILRWVRFEELDEAFKGQEFSCDEIQVFLTMLS